VKRPKLVTYRFCFKHQFLLIIAFVSLHSCQTNTDVQNDKLPIEKDISLNNSSFINEISLLKNTEYPIELFCEIITDSSIYIDKTNDFFYEGDFLVSKHQDSNFISILSYGVGDFNYPYLKTYTNTGKLIDSIYVFNGYCGEGEFGNTRVYATITKNSIYQKDTSVYFHYNNYQIIDSIVVSNSTVELNQYGKFNRIDNQSHKIWVNDTSFLNLKEVNPWSEEIIDTFIKINKLDSFFSNHPFLAELNYPKLKMIKSSENSISFTDDTIAFIIKQKYFNSIEHSFEYYKNTDQITKIDSKRAWGIDGFIPFKSISDIQTIYDKGTNHIKKDNIDDLFEPNLDTNYINIYKVQPNYYIITMDNSDGAGSYVVLFFIKNLKVVKRTTFLPF